MSRLTGAGHRDSEKHVSQIPALHLLQKLDYQLLNKKELDAQRRGKLGNVLLEDVLRQQLAALNSIEHRGASYPFSEANIETAIERLRGHGSAGLVRTNEAVTDLLQLGTSLDQTVEGETRGRQLRYIDWGDPANNVFHVAKEFDVARTGSNSTCRPDIVLFVNGIPLCVIECKGPREDLDQGVSQNIRNQGVEWVPHLFRSVQLLISTKPDAVKYGTIETPLPFWSVWREKEDREALLANLINEPLNASESRRTFGDGFEDEQVPYQAMMDGGRGVTEQDRVLDALCRPERLLDIARRFTLFDLGIKKVTRYQQFFAVKNILERVKTYDAEGRRQGGVVWHTQGSGKSLTMVMLARALALDPKIQNARIVLVTDRVDLDEQLKGTFAACGLEPKKANTGRHLFELVTESKSAVITTVINKFDTALNVRDFKDPSADVFLLVDESHRGQYGEMATRMRRVFPNACYLGFTGTPLMKAEKSTFEKFGGLIDVYAIDQAVKDGAVVPLLYEGRFVERDINRDGIDKWFERASQGLTDEQKADLKRKFSRNRELSQTEQTIRCIAYDASVHFRDAFKGTGFKAQLVAPTKRAALQFKQALDDVGMVSSEIIISGPDEREGYEEVNDDPREEVQKFWKKMMERHGNERDYNKNVVEAFKKRNDPEILIVVDKLLTGFDAPRNTVLYLSKKLAGHNLLQAIARVNRVEEGKDNGIIIDYAGVLGELDQALTTYSALEGFDEEDVHAAVMSVREDIEALPQRHAELLDVFKDVPNKLDEQALERHLGDIARREEFYDRLAAFAAVLSTALASADYRNDPSNERRIDGYKRDLRLYQNLRTAVRKRYREEIDFKVYEARIRKLLDTHIHAHEVTSLTARVNIFDETAFKEAVAELNEPASKADAIASMTKRTITERMEEDPVFYEKFSKLIDQAIEDYRRERLSELDFLTRVNDIRNQVVRPAHEDVPEVVRRDPLAVSFFHTIEKALGGAGANGTARDAASATAKKFSEIVKAHSIVNWQSNVDAQNAMKNDMDDYLFDEVRNRRGIQLTPNMMDDIIETILQSARQKLAG
jgi:type I restriction enzyme, R subunit